MQKIDESKIEYFIAIISEFSRKYDLNLSDAFCFLDTFGGIDFIDEFYEIEHTLSLEDVISDLINICIKNGGNIK